MRLIPKDQIGALKRARCVHHASWMNPDASLHASPVVERAVGIHTSTLIRRESLPVNTWGGKRWGSGMRHIVFMLTYLSLVHLEQR